MASESYSFLDIVVRDEMRERFAAGEVLAILSTDLRAILWANGAGAEWLGYSDIEAAIGEKPLLPATALRQIMAAPGFPRIGSDRTMTLRMTSGLKSRAITLTASAIVLPRGEDALLFALPGPAGEDAVTQARRMVAGFDEPGQFAAMLDADGTLIASSGGFEALGISPETLQELVRDVGEEEDRLVKKRIAGQNRQLPAGIARLTDLPLRHLLIVVDDGSDTLSEDDMRKASASVDNPDVQPGESSAVAEPAQTAAPENGEAKPHDDAPVPRTVRFSWRTDAEGRFSAISGEFVEAMGEYSADVIGRSFTEVANRFGFDPEGEISRLLERRDTWSGRTVMWPLSGTQLTVPVDLAALPAYGRGHVFEGFRGFGIARLGEAEHAPATRMNPGEMEADPQEDAHLDQPEANERIEPPAPVDSAGTDAESDPFLGEKPAITISASKPPVADEKVIDLAEHREAAWNGTLSTNERSAFREIGERLRRANEEAAARDAEEKEAAKGAERTKEPESARPQVKGVSGTAGVQEEDDHSAPEQGGATATAEANAASGHMADEGEMTPSAVAEGREAIAPRPDVMPSAFFQPEHADAATAALSSLPLPLLIHSGDRLHYANREFLKFTGYESLADLEAAGGIGALFEEPEDGEAPGEQPHLRTADGQDVAVEAHLQSIAWQGGKALMLALRPVTVQMPLPNPEEEEKAAELQSRLTEMRAIVDTATDGIAIIADDGTIRSINKPAEALFGFDAEHIAGKPFTSLFAIESRRTIEDYITALSDNGVASVLNDGRQVIGREAQGRFIPLFITIGRLPNGNGFCAVLRDVTHWKRAEEELTQARAQAERASSQKSEFLARVSHEIRTPLNAIIGFSELMMDEKFGPIGNGRYRDYLRDINQSGNHVLELVNDLLDISKIEAGQQEMAHEAVSLNETLGQVVAMMQPQANGERVIIRSSFATRLPDVVADLRSVRQIALNLLSNAVRYTPAGGQVIVSTAYERDGSVAIRIRDTGVGMSSAELDEAMKPFKQINTLRRKRGDGTGLGLPLTRAMVEANRAQFSINSTPGEGTLVEIVFPSTRVLAD